MSDESLREAIRSEKDFDYSDAVMDVTGYLIGGTIGGVAFQAVQGDPATINLVLLTLALIGGGSLLMWSAKWGPAVGRGYTRWRSED